MTDNPKVYRKLLCIYLFLLVICVWTPTSGDSGKILGIFVVNNLTEIVINVCLLVPLALLLPRIWNAKKGFQFIFIGPLTSICIECVQLVIPGRVSDLRDIATNSGGYILTIIAERWIGRKRR